MDTSDSGMAIVRQLFAEYATHFSHFRLPTVARLCGNDVDTLTPHNVASTATGDVKHT